MYCLYHISLNTYIMLRFNVSMYILMLRLNKKCSTHHLITTIEIDHNIDIEFNEIKFTKKSVQHIVKCNFLD